MELPEQNAFKYICGYIIDRCLKNHSCQTCQQFATENNKLDDSNAFIHFKAYSTEKSTFGSLKTPHETFYNFIYKLEKIFVENIESSMLKFPGNTL